MYKCQMDWERNQRKIYFTKISKIPWDNTNQASERVYHKDFKTFKTEIKDIRDIRTFDSYTQHGHLFKSNPGI